MEALTPRQRQRIMTTAEIIAAARRQLRSGVEPTIRSVAAEVGLSSQGMYRYVDSVDDLRRLLVRDILDSTFAYMGGARDRYRGPEDRIAAAAAAFRTWALANPHEFRLAFTFASDPVETEDESQFSTPQRVGAFFAPLFVDLRAATGFQVPDKVADDYKPSIQIRNSKRYHLQLTGPDAPGLIWVFQYVWTRLYGIVALEAFHQIEVESVEAAIFFKATLMELAKILGFTDFNRLRGVLAAELARNAAEAS